MADVPEAAFLEAVAALREGGLLFEEGDRALSLVLPRSPAPMTETMSGNATENAQGMRSARTEAPPAAGVRPSADVLTF